MKSYKLLQWYPSLYDDLEVGTVVEYEDGWIYYTNKRGNKTSIAMDEEELSYEDFWELIEEQKPLFITEDGVECFDRDEYIAIGNDFRKINALAYNCDAPYSSDVMRFVFESNADEYIWRNKPVFSYEDIIDFNTVEEGMWYDIKAIAKERIEQ